MSPEPVPNLPVRVGPALPGKEAPDPWAGLNPKQVKAVEALLQEPTITRAAAVAGVNEWTLRRWQRNAGFRGALSSARREAFGQAMGLTQRYAAVAVATLVKVMNDPTSPPNCKVSAAAVLLKYGREGLELDDLNVRLEALEQAAGEWG
jgi:hypothetical protein